jgi:hypothetical protein
MSKSLIPSVESLIYLRQCSASTDVWTDDYKHISYITLTLHFIDDKWKLWSKVLFICEFPNDRKTANNIRMEMSRRLVQLCLQPDILSKLIFVTDQGANVVCALQLCMRLNCSSHMINTTPPLTTY